MEMRPISAIHNIYRPRHTAAIAARTSAWAMRKYPVCRRMTEARIQRRLAAIMALDIAGFSRLMGIDEPGTLSGFKAHRQALIDPAIGEYRGRIVKLTGDGMLVEFASVVDAVECAVAIQLGMIERNQSTAADCRIVLRIGINLGDIIIDEDDIYGDGVNIAARLEARADIGGICISEDVKKQVSGKVDRHFDDLGELTLKNITMPVRAFRVLLDESPRTQVATLTVPDKPSIAVLPFDNYSEDPEQEFFADGICEDLITDLSKISGLFVVARNSSAVFKGKTTDIRDVATRLGVRYVLEGSVRKAGSRVRVNAQLIEAAAGGHLWADRYDGTAENVFEFQDEVCAKIVSALSVQLTRNEAENLNTVHTNNLDAYELFVRARATPYPPVPERIQSAANMFSQVIEMEPEFAGGYAGVSAMMSFGALWSHGDKADVLSKAVAMAQKAISVDEKFGWSYTALGLGLWQLRRYDEALSALRGAIALRPGDADAHVFFGLILGLDGQYKQAIEEINQAIRLNPLFFNGPYHNVRGQTQMLAEDYEAAAATFKENVERGGPIGPPALCWGAAVYEALDQHKEAMRLGERLATDFPQFTTENWNYLKQIRNSHVRERICRLMESAGIG